MILKAPIEIDFLDFFKTGRLNLLNDISKLNLSFVLEKLNTHNIDYRKKTANFNICLQLNSGVKLTFGNINEIENLDSNKFLLDSLALVAESPTVNITKKTTIIILVFFLLYLYLYLHYDYNENTRGNRVNARECFNCFQNIRYVSS